MKILIKIAYWLLVIGGLAWGLEGLIEVNIFDALLLSTSHLLEGGAEVLIGLSGLLVAYDLLTKK